VVAVVAGYAAEVYPTLVRFARHGPSRRDDQGRWVVILATVVAAKTVPSIADTAVIRRGFPRLLAALVFLWIGRRRKRRTLRRSPASWTRLLRSRWNSTASVQGLDVAAAEGVRAEPLDHSRKRVPRGCTEAVKIWKQLAVVVLVHQDGQPAQVPRSRAGPGRRRSSSRP